MKFLRVKRKKVAGFFLIEALVAISLLLLAIPAALDSAAKGIQSSGYAKNEMIATYLAQEGIELVRWKRDNNFIASNTSPISWLTGFDSSCSQAGGCPMTVNSLTSVFSLCGNGCSGRLYLTSSGAYVDSPSGNTATNFTRKITISDVPGDSSSAKVTSVVTSTSVFGTQTVRVSETIYNWVQP